MTMSIARYQGPRSSVVPPPDYQMLQAAGHLMKLALNGRTPSEVLYFDEMYVALQEFTESVIKAHESPIIATPSDYMVIDRIIRLWIDYLCDAARMEVEEMR